jgi:uncharacterized protein (DUF2267 family)
MAIQGELPGTPAAGPEPTLEWVRLGGGIMGALEARLGSGTRADVLLVDVMTCLRPWLERDTFDGIVDELPWAVRGALRSPGGSPVAPRLETRDAFVAEVGELAQRTPAQAAACVRAAFASLRGHLARGLADAVERELPPELAELWRTAR